MESLVSIVVEYVGQYRIPATVPDSVDLMGISYFRHREAVGFNLPKDRNRLPESQTVLLPSTLTKSGHCIDFQHGEDRIYDNRYIHAARQPTVATHIELFHPAFAFFLSKVFNAEYHVPPEFVLLTEKFMDECAAIYYSDDQPSGRR